MPPVYFVAPWFPEQPGGGAELLTRTTVKHLRGAGVDARVLTTCVPDFRSDWGVNRLPSGRATVDGVPVERFPVDRRDWQLFDQINLRIMRGEPPTPAEAQIYVEENIRSRALEGRLASLPADAVVVYVPYLYGTTYWGMRARPGWIVPCLHDEPYAHLGPYRSLFGRAEGVICNSLAERELVLSLFGPPAEHVLALGTGVETDVCGNGAAFRARLGIEGPLLLHVGRKDHGKNVDQLLADFAHFARRSGAGATLLLVGPGTVPIPAGVRDRVLDFGYASESDKFDAYAASDVLCIASSNESFSFQLMEAWLLGKAALVNARCAVTNDHVRSASGGLAYDGPEEFAACLEWLLTHDEARARMGQNGGEYVRRNFSWDVVVGRIRRALGV